MQVFLLTNSVWDYTGVVMNFLVGDDAIVDEREKRQRYGRGPILAISVHAVIVASAPPLMLHLSHCKVDRRALRYCYRGFL